MTTSVRDKEYDRQNAQRWRENNRDRHRAYSSEWYARNRGAVAVQREAIYKQRKAVLDRFKTFKGCLICGYRQHPAALVFHHVYPEQKTNSVGAFLRQSWQAVRRELAKCVVLCSNCHAVVHSFGFTGDQFVAIQKTFEVLEGLNV